MSKLYKNDYSKIARGHTGHFLCEMNECGDNVSYVRKTLLHKYRSGDFDLPPRKYPRLICVSCYKKLKRKIHV